MTTALQAELERTPASVDGILGADSDDMKMQRLSLWLEENGANAPSLKVATVEGLRGAYATEPIGEGELIVHVPRKLVLTADVAKGSWSGKVITAMGAKPADHGYMAAFLLEIKRDGGLWKPHLDVMPEAFPNLPCFFSDAELEYLRGSYTLRLVKERKDALAFEYKQVVGCFPPVLKFSFDEYAWARACVGTRAYSVTMHGTRTCALVPLADMANHAATVNARWVSESANGFLIVATRPIAPGAAVFETYGSRCNGALLMSYGFCLEDNDNNEAEIELAAPRSGQPFHEQTLQLGNQRGDLRVFRLPATFNVAATRTMFFLLRVGCLEDLPALHRMMVGGAKIDDMPPVSRSNEAAALRTLGDACQQALNRFDTTFEEDDALLAANTLPAKLRNAVVLRRGEKIILARYLNLTKEAIALLQDSGRDLAAFKSDDAAVAGYFELLAKHLPQRHP